jgi:excisionase family DNA binding protein
MPPKLAVMLVRLLGTTPGHRGRRLFVEPKISKGELERRARRRVMSIAEFCERYGPGRTTAYVEIKSGRLRARKVGRRTIITDDDAENWLRQLPTIAPRIAS